MPRFLFLLIAALLVSIFAYFAVTGLNQSTLKSLTDSDLSPDQLLSQLQDIASQPVFTSIPLRGPSSQAGAELTINGLLTATNQHRVSAGLKPLQLNPALNKVAAAKASDMFTQQYFEHVSPTDVGPADLVNNVGYKYLQIGENLALGNYESNAALLQAWMDSPGHRANILKPSYSELGLAAIPGIFEGRQTWLAVQTFGTPSSACPALDPQTQARFDQQYTTLNNLNSDLTDQKKALDAKSGQSQKLAATIASLINQGNQQIKSGNTKVEQGNALAQDNGGPDAIQKLWDEGNALQDSGQASHDQANNKQPELTQIQTELSSIQDNYNQQVDKLNSLNESMLNLTSQLNQQIRAYNKCIDQLKN